MDSVCIIATGLRFVRRGEGPTFMVHASPQDNEARASHVASQFIFEELLDSLASGLRLSVPPPVLSASVNILASPPASTDSANSPPPAIMPVDSSAAFPPSSPPLVVSPTPSDVALFDTFLD